MSSRVFAFRFAAALLFIGLAFGAAPAQAQYYYSGCGACGTSYVVPQPRYYYSSSCGGCGTAYVAPQPQYYVAPQPRSYSSCGNCGGSAYYGGYYVVQPPVVRQQYYTAPAVGVGGYETAVETEVVEPEFEQSPVYYEGQRVYRRPAVDFRINRRIDRRVDRRIERRVERRVDRRVRRAGNIVR